MLLNHAVALNSISIKLVKRDILWSGGQLCRIRNLNKRFWQLWRNIVKVVSIMHENDELDNNVYNPRIVPWLAYIGNFINRCLASEAASGGKYKIIKTLTWEVTIYFAPWLLTLAEKKRLILCTTRIKVLQPV